MVVSVHRHSSLFESLSVPHSVPQMDGGLVVINRHLNRLTGSLVSKTKKVGRHADGGNLYLQVREKTLTKSWIFRYGQQGRHKLGLGSYPDLSLKEARELAVEYRVMLSQGRDPIAERNKLKHEAVLAGKKEHLFANATEEYLKWRVKKETGFKSLKVRQQWKNSLENYAYPHIGNKLVNDITREDIIALLRPIWDEIPETADRLLGRIRNIIAWSVTKGYRNRGFNPAEWKDNLDVEFVKRVESKPRASLPYEQIPEFYKKIVKHEKLASWATQLTILTAVRTNETISAKWEEINWKKKLWVVPIERVKIPKNGAHFVPLSSKALELLRQIKSKKMNEYIFFGQPLKDSNKPHISSEAMRLFIRQFKYVDPKLEERITTHGFRTTFDKWAKKSGYDRELIDLCQHHIIGTEVSRSYGDRDQNESRLKERLELLEEWAQYCLSKC